VTRLDIGDPLHDQPDDIFMLRAGRQRIAAALARARRAVPRAKIELTLDDERVGTASNFSVDEHGDLHADIRLDADLPVERFYCEPVWKRGKLVKIHVCAPAVLVDDETGLTLVDDESRARIEND
jgi:hypothetical protein